MITIKTGKQTQACIGSAIKLKKVKRESNKNNTLVKESVDWGPE